MGQSGRISIGNCADTGADVHAAIGVPREERKETTAFGAVGDQHKEHGVPAVSQQENQGMDESALVDGLGR